MQKKISTRRFVMEWFDSFTRWVSDNYPELPILLSDCGREVVANSLAAHHMRARGQEEYGPLFWARCEWARVDIQFGDASARFAEWATAETALRHLGFVEAKLLYDHLGKDDAGLAELALQMKERRAVGEAFGLVWWVSFKANSPDRLKSVLRLHGLGCSTEFVEIGRPSLKAIWPLTNPGVARLDVALVELSY